MNEDFTKKSTPVVIKCFAFELIGSINFNYYYFLIKLLSVVLSAFPF